MSSYVYLSEIKLISLPSFVFKVPDSAGFILILQNTGILIFVMLGCVAVTDTNT